MEVIGWDRASRYLVTLSSTAAKGRLSGTDARDLAVIVDMTRGKVSVALKLGSIVAMGLPDVWTSDPGPDQSKALDLARKEHQIP